MSGLIGEDILAEAKLIGFEHGGEILFFQGNIDIRASKQGIVAREEIQDIGFERSEVVHRLLDGVMGEEIEAASPKRGIGDASIVIEPGDEFA